MLFRGVIVVGSFWSEFVKTVVIFAASRYRNLPMVLLFCKCYNKSLANAKDILIFPTYLG